MVCYSLLQGLGNGCMGYFHQPNSYFLILIYMNRQPNKYARVFRVKWYFDSEKRYQKRHRKEMTGRKFWTPLSQGTSTKFYALIA